MPDETIIRLPGTEGRPPIRQSDVADELEQPLTRDKRHDVRRDCKIAVTEDRRVECREHGARVDPVDYILYLAAEWDWFARQYRQADAEIRRHHEHLGRLLRQEKNAKARVRKAEPDALREARLALVEAERALWSVMEAWRAMGVRPEGDMAGKVTRAASRCRNAAQALDPADRARPAAGVS